MIVKVKSRKRGSFKQLINYMLTCDRIGFIITHNVRGNNPTEWIQQFEDNETLRTRKRKNSTILSHEILSWHAEDAKHMSVEMIQDLTQKYLELRGQEGMYVAVAHFDKAHPHVHILASGVGYKSGEVMRMSKARFAKVKKELVQYQKSRYPELSHSLPNHGLGLAYESAEKYWARKRGSTDKKRVLQKIIDQVRTIARDEQEFWSLLADEEVFPYVRRNKLLGVRHQGKKYRMEFSTLQQSRQIQRD